MHSPVVFRSLALRRCFGRVFLRNAQSQAVAFTIQSKIPGCSALFASAAICLSIGFAGCKAIERNTVSSTSNVAETNELSRVGDWKIIAITEALDRELRDLRIRAAQLSKIYDEKKAFAGSFEELRTQARSIVDKSGMEWHGDLEIADRLRELHRLKLDLAAARKLSTTLLADDRDLEAIIADLKRTEQKANAVRKDAAYSPKHASYEHAMSQLRKLQLGSARTLGELTSLASLHTQMKASMQDLQPIDTAIDVEIARLTTKITAFATPTPSASVTPNPVVTPTPIILPTATPASSVAATPIISQNAIDAILETLPWGNIVYYVKKSVPLHTETDAKLVISPQKTRQELEAEVLGKLEQNSNIEPRSARVHIAETMRATLKSIDPTALAIVPAREDGTQGVSFVTDTEWLWKIRANQVGTYSVVFTLDAIVLVNDRATTYAIQTHSDTIEVNVTTSDRIKDFIENHWQFLLSTLAIPLGVFLYKLIKGRRSHVDIDSP